MSVQGQKARGSWAPAVSLLCGTESPLHAARTGLSGVAIPSGAEKDPQEAAPGSTCLYMAWHRPLLLQALPSVTGGLSACRALRCAAGFPRPPRCHPGPPVDPAVFPKRVPAHQGHRGRPGGVGRGDGRGAGGWPSHPAGVSRGLPRGARISADPGAGQETWGDAPGTGRCGCCSTGPSLLLAASQVKPPALTHPLLSAASLRSHRSIPSICRARCEPAGPCSSATLTLST